MKPSSPTSAGSLAAVMEIAEGNILEIGTFHGGSAYLFMGLNSHKTNNYLVTVDPYGSKPYESFMEYTEEFNDAVQREAMYALAARARELKINWHHYKNTSLDFLKHIQPLGCWYSGEEIRYSWDTVFLDGEHTWKIVLEEIKLLLPYMSSKGKIIIDNIDFAQLDKENMEEKVLSLGIPHEKLGSTMMVLSPKK